jgi:cell cycle arrest protein BUB3
MFCPRRPLVGCRLDVPEQHRESSLKYQTRCVAALSGSPSFAVASVEGRVAMEYLDPSPAEQEKKYAFKVGAGGVATG